jgi:hypothetical protein
MVVVRNARRQADPSILITEAPVSLDDQQASRRKKYALMMSSRVVCLLLAASVFHFSIVLALLLIAGGMVLPWCAVLIANDRPAKKSEHVARFGGGSRARAIEAARAADDAAPSSGAAEAPVSDAEDSNAVHRVIEG